MNADEFKALMEEDKALAVGSEVEVRWTGNHRDYKGKGKIVKLNAKSVRVALSEEVSTQFTGSAPFPIGHVIVAPRITDLSKWTSGNHVRLIKKTEAAFVLRPNAPPAGMTTEQRWTKAAVDMFVGRKIVAARYLSNEEAENLGWHERALALQLDDGNLIFPSQDDEGNGAGALFTNDDKEPIFPVLSLRRN